MISGDRACGCCGDPAMTWIRGRWARCRKHQERNPCAIEGCRRTRVAPNGYLGDDLHICHAHWNRLVPKGSRARRAYLARLRRGRRLQWAGELAAEFDRLWFAIVRQARRRATEGHIDEAEIARLMGWD